MYTEELAENNTWGIEPNDKHIIVLEERLLYAVKRREMMLEQTPDLTLADLWPVDKDIAEKKRDLENALDLLRKQRRNNIAHSNQW